MKQLTEDEFDAAFTIVPNADGEEIRPNADGIDAASQHLWTAVDADGDIYLLTGYHLVNRIGYVVTQEPWHEATEALWFPGSEDPIDTDAA